MTNAFLSKMSQLNCSGLVSLSQFPLKDEFWGNLRKGNDYATLASVPLYLEFAIARKALVHNIKVNGTSIDIINTHLTPYYKDETENRALRKRQANDIRKIVKGRKYDLAILGMDMNDKKRTKENRLTPAFKSFKRTGFVDLFNFQLMNPITYGHPDNNMVAEGEESATLDYIMIKECLKDELVVTIKEMKMETLKTDGGISFSDHEALSATFDIFG